MKNRAIICICLVLTLIFGMCIGVGAAGGIETISAYLTYNTTVKLDGQTQNLYDGNGKQVYPINYQGTTYLPIRAISNMLGIDVNWDGATKTVLLGKTGEALDFIDTIEPYAGSVHYHYSTSDKSTTTIAGKVYDHYIRLYNRTNLYYDLGGKYTTFTFDLYGENSGEYKIYFYGDNEELLASYTFTGQHLPKTYTIDVTGVTQLLIQGGRDYTYIFNATIE